MKFMLLATLVLAFSIAGMSQQRDWLGLDRAIPELYKIKKRSIVVVAVIDGGVDIAHPALKGLIWTNFKDVAGNAKDDEGNGYVDDIHGWDFIGGPGGDVRYDNLEIVREIRQYKNMREAAAGSTIKMASNVDTQRYVQMEALVDQQRKQAEKMLKNALQFSGMLEKMQQKMGKDSPTVLDFEAYQPADAGEKQVKGIVLAKLAKNPDFNRFKKEELEGGIRKLKAVLDFQLNIGYDPRAIVGDRYEDTYERNYGNSDIVGPDAFHGTGVAGVIAGAGTSPAVAAGIASAVRIMVVRVVPDGDERDKDVANGIRYAVDNGARIINLSFGKKLSMDKPVVDSAVKYAQSKDVLIVHSAGNDGANLDKEPFTFPNRSYADGSGVAKAWIEVGASGSRDDSMLVAPFSDYGKTAVDVFAPGEGIYCLAPGGEYSRQSGTSFAAPSVSLTAALVWSAHPKLTAVQVKDIVLRSVTRIDHPVVIRMNGQPGSVMLTDVCVSGGIVNAYNALLMAESRSFR